MVLRFRAPFKTSPWPFGVQPVRHGAIVGMLSGCVLAVGCAVQPEVETYEARLADHLTETGATMYGAYWCPHCEAQKELFEAAVEEVPYVECDPEGENSQPDLCRDKNIQGYPTWEIGGQFYPGVQSLEALAKLSGFEADQP